MSETLYRETDVSQIIKSLPKEQLQHLSHVEHYVEILTEKLFNAGICPEIITANGYKHFGKSAYYHDIGKAWVPRKILTKAGMLTPAELNMIRKHTLFAEELFDLIKRGSVSGFPSELFDLAHDAAVFHHEWWDGEGYPYGISGEKIPVIARIVSVCDVYDAITSDRVYRKARPHEFACREIETHAGTQFDPIMVKLFLENESEFLIGRR
ncbi:MAG: HD domain-containing phosphohydrolase [Oscillospiraceae bacterium]|nr:HD domain-containing phosphohydrolase [Oscillospiraceae bacterium]